ncbi:hypothetical protein [Neisseria meningitidis]|uniref:hypothetical protein n=1 Tax=Neisseria meningitidis TaxID=487 RepID=UPI0016402AE0|nr:hypothetical protein [Neisseria meningitidis]
MPFGIVINKNQDKAGEPQKVQVVRHGEATLYWFLLIHYLGFGTVGHKGAERYDMPPPVLENTYPAGSKMPSEKAFQTAFVR